jgi:hypothetical protein
MTSRKSRRRPGDEFVAADKKYISPQRTQRKTINRKGAKDAKKNKIKKQATLILMEPFVSAVFASGYGAIAPTVWRFFIYRFGLWVLCAFAVN